MRFRPLLLLAVTSLALSACSAGSLGSSDDEDGGKVTLAFLVDNSSDAVRIGEQLAKDFTAANPGSPSRSRPGPRAPRATT